MVEKDNIKKSEGIEASSAKAEVGAEAKAGQQVNKWQHLSKKVSS